jgi:class 3 adenylate cyclase
MTGLSRKTVTILFSDVVGSTPLGEAVDPESVRAMMARYFDQMRPAIERHGGTIEKYIGDEIMAVFGIPLLHEDDALRAVRAACEMREALSALNRQLSRPLSVRTALNTGEVVTGDGHTLVTGDAVNTAARLRGAADAGEILIGSSTYDLVRDAVVAEPVGAFDLKGKSAPVKAWRVTAVLPDVPGRARRLDAELVGRDAELGLLHQAFARAIGQRACHLFTILGPAGVGKSRLVNELLLKVRPEAATLVGRCLPYGEGITFWPLRDIVHTVDVDALVATREASAIRSAVGLEDPPAPTEETFRAVRKLIETIGRSRAVVVGFDDVHWAEPTFLDLIEHLADSVRDTPVLLVCLARPELLEERPTWGGGKLNATTILLEPLDAEDSEVLVDRLAAGTVTPHVRRTITEVAEGNPLFLEEMVAMLRDDPNAAALPATIHAVLTARLDRLPPAEREVAAAAAAVGRFFSREAVEALLERDVTTEIEALERKQLLRPQPVPFAGGEAYRFRHILISDAAYDALPKAQRSVFHERLAEWFEGTAEGGRREIEELVGYHLERAYRCRHELGEESTQTVALAVRAAELLGSAGRRAFARSDMPAAVNLLDRATVLRREPDLEMLNELAGALWLTGDGRRSDALLLEVIEGAVIAGDQRVEWSARLQRIAQRNLDGAANADEVAEVAARAAEVFEELHDDLGLSQTRRRLSLVARRRGRYGEAAVEAERALNHAGRAGARQEEARIVDALCTSLVLGPTPAPQAAARCRDLLAQSNGSALLDANAQVALAALEAMRGNGAESEVLLDRSRTVYEDLGLRIPAAGLEQVAGEIHITLGELDTAEVELRRALQLAGGARSAAAYPSASLAHVLDLTGRVRDARDFAEHSRETGAADDIGVQIAWRRVLAQIELRTGNRPAALALATEAVALAEQTDSPNVRADALVALAAADPERRAEHRDEAHRLYTAKGNVVAAARVISSEAAVPWLT